MHSIALLGGTCLQLHSSELSVSFSLAPVSGFAHTLGLGAHGQAWFQLGLHVATMPWSFFAAYASFAQSHPPELELTTVDKNTAAKLVPADLHTQALTIPP
jgi:hypothetical protein